jgi:membrane protease YdiL (CAAX protease family)
MFSPELAKAKMGYRNVRADGFPRGISPVEWVLILLTSLVFGLAHFLAGSGWEAGKVSTAFLAGFVFAIMYVAYGAYASILLHWFFNYYFDVLSIAETAYGGVFQQISNLASYTNLLGGGIILTVFMLATAFRLGNYFANRASGQAGRTQSIE